MAIVGYKLGLTEFADAALDYLQLHQMPSGGFLGSYGPGAAYGPGKEISWACKYFLDAYHWRIQCHFRGQSDYPEGAAERADARLPTANESALGRVDRPGQRRTLARRPNAFQRRAQAQVLVITGFARYQRGDVVGARAAFLSAIRHDAGWARNRGIMSIIIRSTIWPWFAHSAHSGEPK